MAFPSKLAAKPPAAAMAAIRDSAGLPPGKRMSVRNMARLRPAKGARRAKANDDGDHEYR